MSGMSYRKLAQMISEMPEERKNDDVTIVIDSEVFQVKGMDIVNEKDDLSSILDSGHHFLFLN